MLRTRILRTSLAPVLFAAAISGCANDAPPPPSAETWLAAPVALADPHSAATPRLVRGGSMPARPAATAAESALAHVAALAPRWGAAGGTAELAPIGTVKVGGGEIVRIRQRLDGIPVDKGELRVLVGQGGTLVAASGVLAGADQARDVTGFAAPGALDGRAAVARAMSSVHRIAVPAASLSAMAGKPAADPGEATTWVSGTVGDVHVGEARARRAWYRSPDSDALAAAWIVEAYSGPVASTDAHLHRVVIAARGGRVLEQRDLTVDALFNYRVWAETEGDRRPLDGPTANFTPHPTGSPNGSRPAFVTPTLVSVDGLNDNGAGGSDPWLTAGATSTNGNNVDAYTDINAPDGINGDDFRATTTAAGSFDRTYDTAQSPLLSQSQQMAAISQLFFSINWLHDEWYDAGFNEVAGNGQEDNFGRGGVDGDQIRAEAQDNANAGRRNNANMSTPEDGMNPRMQVYLWTGSSDSTLDFTGFDDPASVSTAAYGPTSYDVSGTVIAGVDTAGPAGSTTDGCDGITNNVTDRIVLLDRGNCTFKTKTLRAQEAGARGVIIANNTGTTAPSLGNDAMVTTPITIPTMGIPTAAGAALRSALNAGAVTTRLFRQQDVETDGALDGALVAHEFGHYVHHRLSVCGTPQCGAMSEGWGDFLALHMMARPGDNLDGTYSVSGYAFAGDPYFGIRRAPYSVDTSKNAFTFRMVSDDESIPNSHPIGGGGPNSEVHNAGEVWSQALWEVYVALQKMPGADFVATRNKMARYVVAGLLMSPPDGTFTEIRDSILAAAFAASTADHDVMAAAFARRGLGTCAAAPARDSSDFIGTTESMTVSGRALPGEPTVTLTTDCDADGIMDAGDVATVTLPLANAGAIALADGADVTVATTTPGLAVPSAALSVASIAPYGNAAVTFEVTADGSLGAGPVAGSFDITITAEGCTPTQTVNVPVRLQADIAAAASATDAFDAPSVWTASGDFADLVWKQTIASGLDRQWSGADAGTMVDVSLESPDLVAGSGAVVISFDHSHEFEFSNDTYWDGGVVEISTDGGATWADVSVYADPGYNGELGGDSGNPLQGRAAFGDINPSFPSQDRVSLDLGTQLSGMTFRVRFRIATDGAVGAPGWKIDDFAVTGLTNTPFPVQGSESGGGACVSPNPDAGTGPGDGDEPGGCCSTGGGARPSDVLGGLLAGAFLLLRGRRRRKQA